MSGADLSNFSSQSQRCNLMTPLIACTNSPAMHYSSSVILCCATLYLKIKYFLFQESQKSCMLVSKLPFVINLSILGATDTILSKIKIMNHLCVTGTDGVLAFWDFAELLIWIYECQSLHLNVCVSFCVCVLGVYFVTCWCVCFVSVCVCL